ncbi:hypothetical protein J1N35_036726 [Gossypium stocksii]|uniref:Reverse transcriptase zinc-binding domain-containing protein n=1 Tax=Gossypium stocksii TaxID=47602 RepID=A0A9D3UIH6_9ROSI|nr:hypothetical protein J1N35_036726 [Gossypium stocksii]
MKVQGWSEILSKEYEMLSGQRVNFDKSLIYFGATAADNVKENIANEPGVRMASNPEKYLGLPMMVGRKKSWAFAHFIDRFRKRVAGWSLRFLSIRGKEVFVKSVLQAMPIYVMQCFVLTKSLCRKLEGIMNKFWWTNNKSLKGIHWCNWDVLCCPKINGGLGFKNLFLFNKALLAKQIWRLLSQPTCLLARVLKARYYPHSNILAAKVGSYPSFTWRSICSARDLVEDGVVWRVGNGATVNIWNDPWLSETEQNRISGHQINPNWTTVEQLIEAETGTWNKKLVLQIFDEAHASRILSIPLSRARSEDMLVWKHEGSGEYSVKSGYRVLITDHLLKLNYITSNTVVYKDFYRLLWALHVPAKVKIHVWRLFNNFLPNYCNLNRRKLRDRAGCPLCKAAPENTDHLLWSCKFLQNVWASLQIKIAPVDNVLTCKNSFINTFCIADDQNKRLIALSLWALCDSKKSLTAVLARDFEGNVMGVETYLFMNVADAFVAEARACERSLLFALRMGFRRLIVEGDSLTFEEVHYLFVPRSVNGAAHTLALEGRRRQFFGFWEEGVPDSVMTIVEKDREHRNLR